MNTEAVAKRLVELCRRGEFDQAQRELYAQDAVSIEMPGAPAGGLGDARGLAAIFDKARQFDALVDTMHGGSVSDPLVAGDWFSVAMAMDVTFKGRERAQMSEIVVYRVRAGKVVSEQFFYDMA